MNVSNNKERGNCDDSHRMRGGNDQQKIVMAIANGRHCCSGLYASKVLTTKDAMVMARSKSQAKQRAEPSGIARSERGLG